MHHRSFASRPLAKEDAEGGGGGDYPSLLRLQNSAAWEGPGEGARAAAAVEDDEDGPAIWEAGRSVGAKKLAPLGRSMGVLLAAEPRELERALAPDRPRSQQGSIGKAAISLLEHGKDMIQKRLSLEPICIPILEHAVRFKERSYRKRSFILLVWLLRSKDTAIAVAETLKAIIGSVQFDNRVKLGWCVLVREMVDSCGGQQDVDNLPPSGVYEIFVTCVPLLVQIVCTASVKAERRRVPTRLTTAAADCFLMITKTLATGLSTKSEDSSEQSVGVQGRDRTLITPLTSSEDCRPGTNWLVADITSTDDAPTTSSDIYGTAEKRELALWEQLDSLLSLVRELEEWNDRTRSLFTRGLQYIHRRLLLLVNYRNSMEDQGGYGDVSVGAAVLCACWQHFSDLMVINGKKIYSQVEPIVRHWLSALQYYTQQAEDWATDEENRKAMDMREYSLACLCLIYGRLDHVRLEHAFIEMQPELLKAMFDQLRGANKNIVDLAVSILREMLFRPSSSTSGVSASAAQVESVVPMLLDMLDARDTAARAAVLLVAEYFALYPLMKSLLVRMDLTIYRNQESVDIEQLFSRLDSAETLQRRNALDVLTELFSICTRSTDMINSSFSQTVAKHLLKRLGDTELSNRVEASALFAKLDPSFTLPALLKHLYSSDGRVRSAASAGVVSVLKGQSDEGKIVSELLDAVTIFMQSSLQALDGDAKSEKMNGADVDRVMRLVPEWAASVKDWKSVARTALAKMFKEPANAVILRFLSYISVQLADQVHILFPLILDRMACQSNLTEAMLSKLSKGDSLKDDERSMGSELLQRLSPLLALRVLPLNAFDSSCCRELYGEQVALQAGDGAVNRGMSKCIMSILIERACGMLEFEDVRKVAAELTGRLLPDIMIPLVTAQLEDATQSHDLLKVKACIYIFCTSLGIRVQESLKHPSMDHIRHLLTKVLLWPWSQDYKEHSELGKAQHGCIDCLAMMICAELPELQGVATRSLERSGMDSPTQLVKDLTVSVEPERDFRPLAEESNIKLFEKLPESEQLRLHQFVDQEQTKLGKRSSVATSERKQPKLIEELSDSGNEISDSNPGVLHCVIDCLTGHGEGLACLEGSRCEMSGSTHVGEKSYVRNGRKLAAHELGNGNELAPLPFRVCMANVLISTCQKVSPAARGTLASIMIPPLITFIQSSADSKLRGTCLHVLFTAVYHLKSVGVLPYAADLFGLSTAAIKSQGLLEERIGGAKLLASLLGSEEAVERDLAPYLVDAQVALASISAMDSSPELRVLCEKLLTCLSTPINSESEVGTF